MENYCIRLSDLFDGNNLPEWIDQLENCIYLIENLVNHKKYIGQTVSIRRRFVDRGRFSHKEGYLQVKSGNWKGRYLYNAIVKYGPENFIVEVLWAGDFTKDELNQLEIQEIARYNTYLGEGYNLNSGGEHTEHLHDKLVEMYPETNGVPPKNIKIWNEAGRAAVYKKYGGMPPACKEARLNMWPGTNGVCPWAIEAWWKASLRNRKLKFPETNGANPKWIKAGKDALKKKYPETNGMPPETMKKGRDRLKELYPESNGVSPQFWKAAQAKSIEKYGHVRWPDAAYENKKINAFCRKYDNLTKICTALRNDGHEIFTFQLWSHYRKLGYKGGNYVKSNFYVFFINCETYGYDRSFIESCLRSDWHLDKLKEVGYGRH